MSVDLGLTDYQFAIANSAGTSLLTMGQGTNYDFMEINGLTDYVSRRDDRPMARHHGGVPGVLLADSRDIEADIIVRKGAQSDSAWRDSIDNFESAFSITEGEGQRELHWQFPGEEERFVRCRVTKRQTVRSFQSETGLYAVRVQLVAADPRVYIAAQSVTNNQSGTFSISNNGKTRAYPILNFSRSAATRVRVTNNTTGVVLDVNGLPSASTDVTADMDKYIRGEFGLVIFVSATNHYAQWVLPRVPFYLMPGSNSLTLNNGTNVDVSFWHPFL